ncbi:lysozyme inhibitor LprI family protein [Alkalicoccus daliensis]|uniref:Uncharacterized protein n=1 Tax=Alkalicoccus daliensis TaxID=745820 RepID=A0A1H0IYV4_9BACI|nr:lysozyme inhibitor LprI family protein [Alkalicoccus daliensis]SDO36678.1 hypothetical protein SAMN04488053_1127 [Alkalicoccus daliensis]
MLLNKRKIAFWIMMITLLLLSACGKSPEKAILGSWKAVSGNEIISSYFIINEDRFTARAGTDETPESVEYILTKMQDDNFMIEIINPDGTIEFLFEGFFENKDTIAIVSEEEAENAKLVRVDNLAAEMANDEKRKQEEEEKLQEERDKEFAIEEEKRLQEEKEEELAREEQRKHEEEKKKERAEKEEQKKIEREKEEERLQEEKEQQMAKTEENEAQDTVESEIVEEAEAEQKIASASSKNEYLQKGNNLTEKINNEAKELFEQDTQLGFYGQYYQDWDDLLNEVWGELKTNMPESEFETLKQEQIEWIQMKEQNFAERPKEPASERASGMDYLAFETKDRTYYLIENHLK